MNNLSNKLKTEKYLIISADELHEMLKSSVKILEQDTRLRDYIRILKLDDAYIFQEITNHGEIMIRQFNNEADAMNLVNDRMQIYDKMWDGCGCKINYYE